MTGSDAYWVWHSYEAPYQLTALNGAKSLIRAGNEVHFTFHPISGDIVQILPANRAGRGLVNKAGGVQTNRQGRCCIQVEVIAYAKRPWTGDLTPAGRKGLAKLIAYAKELGVPAKWPAGPPPAYPNGSSPRSVAVWNGPGGHFSHSQIPENTHGDPGAIDIRTLFAPIAPTPVPSPAPQEEVMALSTEDKKAIADIVDARLKAARVGWGYRNFDTKDPGDMHQLLVDVHAAVGQLREPSLQPVVTTEQLVDALRQLFGSLAAQQTQTQQPG